MTYDPIGRSTKDGMLLFNFAIWYTIPGILWVIYFIQSFAVKQEQFTPKINSMCRPYMRTLNQTYETFVNNYGSNVIINNLKKWNVY